MSDTKQTLARLVMEVLTADQSYTEMKKCVRNLEMVFPSEMVIYIHKNSRARMILDLTRLHAKLIMAADCDPYCRDAEPAAIAAPAAQDEFLTVAQAGAETLEPSGAACATAKPKMKW